MAVNSYKFLFLNNKFTTLNEIPKWLLTMRSTTESKMGVRKVRLLGMCTETDPYFELFGFIRDANNIAATKDA